MKKLILFSIFAMLLFNARAQEEKTYHKNEQLESIGNYLDGEKTGEWKWYYENGELEKTGTFLDGKLLGEWKYALDQPIKLTIKEEKPTMKMDS